MILISFENVKNPTKTKPPKIAKLSLNSGERLSGS